MDVQGGEPGQVEDALRQDLAVGKDHQGVDFKRTHGPHGFGAAQTLGLQDDEPQLVGESFDRRLAQGQATTGGMIRLRDDGRNLVAGRQGAQGGEADIAGSEVRETHPVSMRGGARFANRRRPGYLLFRMRLLLRFYLAAALPLLFAASARGQVQVELKLSRRLYITYEPIYATVIITNLAGRDLELEAEGGTQWFGFEVTQGDGNLLVPLEPDYKITALRLASGERVTRRLDLAPLFPIREFGQHRLRATIFVRELGRFFSSNVQAFDLTDGRTIMRQTVGVPGTGEMRDVQLMSFQLPNRLSLYVRIRDRASGIVYGTQNIGRYLAVVSEPQTMLDAQNRLHILHQAAPRAFLYTQIGLDGQRITQEVFTVGNSGGRPTLARTGAKVQVKGGKLAPPESEAIDGAPSIGERPPGLPPVR